MKKRGYKISSNRNLIILVLIIIVVLGSLYFLGPTFTSFVIKEVSYTQDIGFVATTSGNYTWNLENIGDLKSLKLDGSITKSGNVRVYIENNGVRHLILDSSKINISETNNTNAPNNLVTGFVVEDANETINDKTLNKSMIINLQYKNGTVYDENNDGVEGIYGVIDLSVEDTSFMWDADKSRLCTLWDVYNEDNNESTATLICYGNADCCAYVGLVPKRDNWTEPYYASYGMDGAGHNNIIGAKVIYADFNLTGDGLYSNVTASLRSALSAEFFDEYQQFSSVCEETCILAGFNKTSYKIVFEIDNAILRIDKFHYAVTKELSNRPPVLLSNIPNLTFENSIKLNLSSYFYDPDGDILYYTNSITDGISVAFNGDMALINAESGFNGTKLMFITANDTSELAISNVFAITFHENISNISIAPSLKKFLINNGLEGIASIDENGNMFIVGKLFYNQNSLLPPPSSFIIQNASEAVVAFINPSGDVYLSGGVYQHDSLNSFGYKMEIRNDKDELVVFFDDTGNLKLKGALTQNYTKP